MRNAMGRSLEQSQKNGRTYKIARIDLVRFDALALLYRPGTSEVTDQIRNGGEQKQQLDQNVATQKKTNAPT
jgi:hypothetical protein